MKASLKSDIKWLIGYFILNAILIGIFGLWGMVITFSISIIHGCLTIATDHIAARNARIRAEQQRQQVEVERRHQEILAKLDERKRWDNYK